MGFINYADSSILLPFDGTNGATTATDWSINPKTLTFNGNAQISTAQSLYYGSSLLLDGNGDYVSIPSSADLNIGANNFDICIGVYLTAYANNMSGSYWVTLLGKDILGAREYNLSIVGTSSSFVSLDFTGFIDNTNYQYVSIPYSFALNTWYKIKVTRLGNLLFVHINDILQNSGGTAFSPTIQTTFTPLIIGASLYNGTYPAYTYGYLQDVGIFNNSAQWNSSPISNRLIGDIAGNVKDINNNNASRIITVCPRTNPTRSFPTISDAGTGNYTLRVPATEVSRIALADEVTLYNDIVDRILVV